MVIRQLPGLRPERLVLVQHGLVDLINLLDPESQILHGNRNLL
jgi:hypothetical protein